MSLTIGEAAKAAGVTPRAVRLYESKGLLPPPTRTPSGYRTFDTGHVESLRFIRQARSLGLSLDAIAEILTLSEHETPCARACALLDQRVQEIDQAIAELQALRNTITAARDTQPGPAGRCTVIENAQSN